MNLHSENEKDFFSVLKESGNEHILTYWDELSDSEKNTLMSKIKSIDFEKISRYFENRNISENTADSSSIPAESLKLEKRSLLHKEAGIEALKSGEVAFLTVAGGQASRLGIEQPKGCFGISPVNKHSLFQIFAEKILYYSRYYKVNFYWYIMTSEDNYCDTVSFFKLNSFFGLKKDNVIFFKQGMLPSLTTDGRLILKSKSDIFMNPDGHGGILTALNSNNLTEKLVNDKVKYLSYFQVDNALLNMADPYFIGYHIMEKSQVTTKVIKKAYPEEKLGTVVKVNDSTNKIIEYSDMSPEMMNEKDESGCIKYLMGSIGVHIFNVDFIKETTSRLPIHYAKKKINCIDANSPYGEMKVIDAYKFETFVFDMIPLAQKSAFFETVREEEFFPLKNAEGIDSIETATAGQIELYKSWLKESGFEFDEKAVIEISPLFAPDRDLFYNEVNFKRADINRVLHNTEDADGKIFIS